MKKLIATVGWLLISTASHGEAGQHTGVGGNPAVPPPQPSSVILPPLVFQAFIIQPGLVIVLPEAQEPAQAEESSDNDSGDEAAE